MRISAPASAASKMMNQLPTEQRDVSRLEAAGSRYKFDAAILQLALTVALIVSIVVVFAVAGASGVLAQARPDLMVMEESTGLTTAMIVGVILVVMGILTVLAIRDASPTKRGASRRPSVRR